MSVLARIVDTEMKSKTLMLHERDFESEINENQQHMIEVR